MVKMKNSGQKVLWSDGDIRFGQDYYNTGYDLEMDGEDPNGYLLLHMVEFTNQQLKEFHTFLNEHFKEEPDCEKICVTCIYARDSVSGSGAHWYTCCVESTAAVPTEGDRLACAKYKCKY